MIEGNTANEVVDKSIKYVVEHGESRVVWGGTIPDQIGDKGQKNDFDRAMIETEPFVSKLLNPLARWSDFSRHWPGISLRETEDHFQHYNPGEVIRYSKLYPVWLTGKKPFSYFNYTYGERLCRYPYNKEQISGMERNLFFEFNQVDKIIELLREHPSTRKACISTWFPPVDLGNAYCPCNMIFQIRVIDGKLTWITTARSLDVLRGLTENIFMFTLWQEYIAKQLDYPLGPYFTVALNPHIYDDQIKLGYHKHTSYDAYNFHKPKRAFRTEFPSDEFKMIDSLLFSSFFKGEAGRIYKRLVKLPEYWQCWKASLVAEYFRLKGYEKEAQDFLRLITNEFLFPTLRRFNIIDDDVYGFLPPEQQKEMKRHKV